MPTIGREDFDRLQSLVGELDQRRLDAREVAPFDLDHPAERVVDESLAHAAAKGGPVLVPGKRWKVLSFVARNFLWVLGPLRKKYRRD